MARDPNRRPDETPADDEPSDDGIIHDEYTDESLEGVDRLDALDVPSALRDESLLADVADSGDGIEEIDVDPIAGGMMDTIDTGARSDHHVAVDEAEMGLGAEPRSIEELEEASIGSALRGRGAVMRDDEVHGEALFDSPDDVDDDDE